MHVRNIKYNKHSQSKAKQRDKHGQTPYQVTSSPVAEKNINGTSDHCRNVCFSWVEAKEVKARV